MKILLYNIEYGTGLRYWRDYIFKFWRYLWASRKAMESIVQFLQHKDPDVICLVEVDAGSVRARSQSQVEQIAEGVGMENYKSYSKYKSHSFLGSLPMMSSQHNAILSRKKGKFKSHYLESGVKRLVEELIINGISIFLIHLGLRKKLRKKQFEELSVLLQNCPRPYVLCGDFNILKGLKEIVDFVQNNQLRLTDVEATYPAKKPRRYLDLILVSPEIRVIEAGVSKVEWSDHLPVWIEIKND